MLQKALGKTPENPLQRVAPKTLKAFSDTIQRLAAIPDEDIRNDTKYGWGDVYRELKANNASDRIALGFARSQIAWMGLMAWAQDEQERYSRNIAIKLVLAVCDVIRSNISLTRIHDHRLDALERARASMLLQLAAYADVTRRLDRVESQGPRPASGGQTDTHGLPTVTALNPAVLSAAIAPASLPFARTGDNFVVLLTNVSAADVDFNTALGCFSMLYRDAGGNARPYSVPPAVNFEVMALTGQNYAPAICFLEPNLSTAGLGVVHGVLSVGGGLVPGGTMHIRVKILGPSF